jgi:hypothetical protein
VSCVSILLQVISAASPPAGKVLVANLADIQGQKFDEPTVVISDVLGGLEDVPEGVVAVVSSSVTDILSHIAIRARGQVKTLGRDCRAHTHTHPHTRTSERSRQNI